ncbi:DUF4974 domain-containing protein [Planctomycetes bacterium K23_9]|uniref:Uncharacterized protein n=1 Tax=Stieleria marina TaxID=1930275 RepID=A0A517NZA6_9BACT|nr:hypothetical protein K239x_44430 [Planctomycetes bacterium K23_9]
MSLNGRTLCFALIFFIPCTSSFAQINDPFGSDPFGEAQPAAKAEIAAPADDPFGTPQQPAAEAANDPFGQTAKPAANQSDPFGGATQPAAATDNPFGDTRKPAAKKAASAMTDPFGKPAPKVATPAATPQPSLGSSKVNEQIRAKLNDPTSQFFVETPLGEAIAVLSRTHNIPMVINASALEEIGLSNDVPVNLTLQNVSLRSFLRLMLKSLDCTYVIKNEVLQITTMESAEQNLTVRSYTMSEELAPRADKIIKALTASVVSDTWSQSGGPSSVNAVDHVLVVSTTEIVHEEVEKFVAMLEDAFKKRKGL